MRMAEIVTIYICSTRGRARRRAAERERGGGYGGGAPRRFAPLPLECLITDTFYVSE